MKWNFELSFSSIKIFMLTVIRKYLNLKESLVSIICEIWLWWSDWSKMNYKSEIQNYYRNSSNIPAQKIHSELNFFFKLQNSIYNLYSVENQLSVQSQMCNQ